MFYVDVGYACMSEEATEMHVGRGLVAVLNSCSCLRERQDQGFKWSLHIMHSTEACMCL